MTDNKYTHLVNRLVRVGLGKPGQTTSVEVVGFLESTWTWGTNRSVFEVSVAGLDSNIVLEITPGDDWHIDTLDVAPIPAELLPLVSQHERWSEIVPKEFGMTEKAPSKKILAADSLYTRLYYAFLGNISSGQQRRGQAWMNALREVEPGLYDEVTGTDADCFYDDRKLGAFKEYVFGTRSTDAS